MGDPWLDGWFSQEESGVMLEMQRKLCLGGSGVKWHEQSFALCKKAILSAMREDIRCWRLHKAGGASTCPSTTLKLLSSSYAESSNSLGIPWILKSFPSGGEICVWQEGKIYSVASRCQCYFVGYRMQNIYILGLFVGFEMKFSWGEGYR